MRIAVFGASGRIGLAVVKEALERGHRVVAAQRSQPGGGIEHPSLEVRTAFVDRVDSVRETVAGCDAVVNAVSGLGWENTRISAECVEPLVDGMLAAGCRRLVWIGTAGTLHVAPGVMRMDSADFPSVLLDEARAHREVQRQLRGLAPGQISWSYFSPPALIEPGERTGSVILGLDDLLFNSAGRSVISNEDYAMALVDELERPRFIGTRFTAVSR